MRLLTLAFLASAASGCMPPEWGAAALLHPSRHEPGSLDLPHDELSFRSDGLLLKAWLFRGQGPRRGLIVYLHGSSDNRRSGGGLAKRFCPEGFDVLAYDSRAHGESEGRFCTYGYYERHDVSRALESVGATKAILFGVSLGGAVALQAAPLDERVRGVVAVSAFSDLETVARERAPWFATSSEIAAAFAIAEREADFRIVDVSPAAAARRIRVPVLLIHGEADQETPPDHSRRIFWALSGPKRLLLVAGAGHNDVLASGGVWTSIEGWLADFC